ncbi:MAG: glycoside hydrolase family 125 protein, partial [Clostridia bacterium]|nr:glycoside hydrolase family 125 protein [Clostridia bacterium]
DSEILDQSKDSYKKMLEVYAETMGSELTAEEVAKIENAKSQEELDAVVDEIKDRLVDDVNAKQDSEILDQSKDSYKKMLEVYAETMGSSLTDAEKAAIDAATSQEELDAVVETIKDRLVGDINNKQDEEILDQSKESTKKILEVFETEQDHSRSPYFFRRENCPPTDTLINNGRGAEVAVTGMTWSGFRPSDDACDYGYLIPSNMFAVVTLGYTAEIMRTVYEDEALAVRAEKLAAEIREGIEKYGVVEHPVFGRMYAYETDGMGHYTFMDDANVPSLMSIPYLGYCSAEDETYRNTRAFVLSRENPFYYEGTAAKGVGSPHTPPEYIWHIALSMQGLTTTDKAEAEALLNLLVSTDGDTGFMHEGVYVNDPKKFTRDWFAWSNSLFSEFVLHYLEL